MIGEAEELDTVELLLQPVQLGTVQRSMYSLLNVWSHVVVVIFTICPDMLVTVIQFYICFYLYIHLHNNDSVYNLEPDAHAQNQPCGYVDFRF